MTTVGIVSTGVQDGVNAAVGALFGQLEAIHDATQVITTALVPPTNDSASGTATAQEQVNTTNFDAMFKVGMTQVAELGTVVTADNHVHMAADAAGAGAAAAIQA